MKKVFISLFVFGLALLLIWYIQGINKPVIESMLNLVSQGSNFSNLIEYIQPDYLNLRNAVTSIGQSGNFFQAVRNTLEAIYNFILFGFRFIVGGLTWFFDLVSSVFTFMFS